MPQRVDEKIAVFATIEPECHFVQIGREMLCANIMPSAHNAALQERECGFDGVRVNHTGDIFFGVIDRPVRFLMSLVERPRIDRRFVCDDHFDIFTQILSDDLSHGLGVRIARVDKSQFAVPFADSENNFFFAARAEFAGLSADVSFIDFDRAIHHRLFNLSHRRADSVAQVPCCLVTSDSQRALNLASGHSLFGFAEKQGCCKPSLQRKMRVIENSAGHDGELVAA